MIAAEIRRRAGRIAELRVQGHAGTARHGQDLVCAAVSAIVQTALLGLQRIDGAPPPDTLAEGDVHWSGTTGDAGQAILETCLLGLRDLERDHPQAISVAVKEVAT